MKSRLHDVPVLKAVSSYIEAYYFNRVRLALCRHSNPLRVELVNLRGLDVILTDDEWICVDRTLNDLPIFAWTDFEYKTRADLRAPVPCQLRFFHNHADLICGSVLDLLNRHLERTLKQDRTARKADVIYLKKSGWRRGKPVS